MRRVVITILFCALMAAGSVVALVVPADVESVASENKTMTEMPELNGDTVFSGEFSTEFESYISDHIGFRSALITASNAVESAAGVSPSFGEIVTFDKDAGTGTTQKTNLLIYDGKIMEIFRRNTSGEENYITAVNYYAENLPEEVNLYNVLVPTQLEFQSPMYSNIGSSQRDTINRISAELDNRVTEIDVYTTLAEHYDSEYEYFKTDHHWTATGAYYAYCEVVKAMGMEPVDINDYEKKSIENMYGSLYSQIKGKTDGIEPDTLEYYETDPDDKLELSMQGLDENGDWVSYDGVFYDLNQDEPAYTFFFSGDQPMIEINNPEVTNGRTIIVLKDSYANAFIPWLCKNFENTIVIDPRTYWATVEDIFDLYDVTDVLIMNYMFTTGFPDYCQLLVDICTVESQHSAEERAAAAQ